MGTLYTTHIVSYFLVGVFCIVHSSCLCQSPKHKEYTQHSSVFTSISLISALSAAVVSVSSRIYYPELISASTAMSMTSSISILALGVSWFATVDDELSFSGKFAHDNG